MELISDNEEYIGIIFLNTKSIREVYKASVRAFLDSSFIPLWVEGSYNRQTMQKVHLKQQSIDNNSSIWKDTGPSEP